MAKKPTPAAAPENQADAAERFTQQALEQQIEAADRVTATAADEGRLPENAAVANPAPAQTMNNAGGAFVEQEVIDGIPVDHPSIENNPRQGTSGIQNGGDFNDPFGRNPGDDGFTGQGLDLSVYGKG
jgi:hypothetical protein